MASDYLYIKENFDKRLADIAKIMDQSNLDWFVVAGWALDLFVRRKIREHKDIEISIFRDQVPKLYEQFPNNHIDMVTGDKKYETLKKDSIIDNRGHLIIRSVSSDDAVFDIELFTTERKDSYWVFRKQSDIQVLLSEAILTSKQGVKYLAPQLVLLFKAWFYPLMDETIEKHPNEADFILKCWETDCKDFQVLLPLMSNAQREWLYFKLTEFVHNIPWLTRFKV